MLNQQKTIVHCDAYIWEGWPNIYSDTPRNKNGGYCQKFATSALALVKMYDTIIHMQL